MSEERYSNIEHWDQAGVLRDFAISEGYEGRKLPPVLTVIRAKVLPLLQLLANTTSQPIKLAEATKGGLLMHTCVPMISPIHIPSP